MIEGRLVRLRPVEREDLVTFVRWVNDPEVTEHLLVEPPMSLEDEEAWFEHVQRSPEKVYSIETREGRLIGNLGIIDISWPDRRADIGIMIGEKDCWSRGYGTDAITLFLKFAFEEMNLNRVGLYTDSDNLRAQACYKRCGFVVEGLSRAHRFKRGRYLDSIQMSILRADWNRLQQVGGQQPE